MLSETLELGGEGDHGERLPDRETFLPVNEERV